jgi:hypothetical protein
VVQPIVQYAQDMLDHLSGRYRQVVEAMSEEGLNWQPGGAGTNSLAQIVRHVVSGQQLIFNWALGTPPQLPMTERSRGLQNDPATRAELLDLLAQGDRVRAELLVQLDAADLSERVPSLRGEARSRFFYVAHSVGEAREHIGHAELTRQLWEAWAGAAP